jgi:peptide/nickel transport system substrate-binding protein
MLSRRITLLLAAATIAPLPAVAQAARRLRMGVALAPNSIDPHYHNTGQNNSALRHVFDTLCNEMGLEEVEPCLAESWKMLDPTTWQFNLRKGVTFTDGTPFTADDVIFTFERVPTVPNSPGLYTPFVKPVVKMEAKDPHTLILTTSAPFPTLPREVSWVQILSRKIHTGAATDDFNSLKVAIGTGPYKIIKYVPGDEVQLVRNDAYWGNKQPWETVQLKAVANDSTRLGALLAGDLDLMFRVGTPDLPRVQNDPKVELTLSPSLEVVYLFPDSTREISTNMTDKAGKPLEKNPLRDVRVRRALSMSIDRQAIVDRVMQKAGAVANQMAVQTMEGFNKSLPPIPYDPAAARKLLAEAGYPDGWKMKINGPIGFIANDDKILQAVGSFFSRVGVETEVESVSPAVYFSKATAREYGVFMTSYTGPVAIGDLKALIVTKDPKTGDGPFNRHLYSNKKLDDLVYQAQATLDPVERIRLTGEAMKVGMDDVAVIPLVQTMGSVATRKGVVKYNSVPIGWGWAMLAEPLS